MASSWRLVDELRAAGLEDPGVSQAIRVCCTRCGAKVRGSRKRVESQAACPACKASPFEFTTGEP